MRIGRGGGPCVAVLGLLFLLLACAGPAAPRLNAAPGQTLTTTDGRFAFNVYDSDTGPFSANDVVVSNFIAVPEPGMAAMLLVVGVGATCRRRPSASGVVCPAGESMEPDINSVTPDRCRL